MFSLNSVILGLNALFSLSSPLSLLREIILHILRAREPLISIRPHIRTLTISMCRFIKRLRKIRGWNPIPRRNVMGLVGHSISVLNEIRQYALLLDWKWGHLRHLIMLHHLRGCSCRSCTSLSSRSYLFCSLSKLAITKSVIGLKDLTIKSEGSSGTLAA